MERPNLLVLMLLWWDSLPVEMDVQVSRVRRKRASAVRLLVTPNDSPEHWGLRWVLACVRKKKVVWR